VVSFLIVVIDYDAAHKYAEKILCCFVCGWKGELWETLQFFLWKLQKLYHCENNPPPPPHVKLTQQTWDRNFPFLSDNA
jgi:hypothetical protein